ncbi:MAG: recombinase family protein [Patescibacteria group bacterium]
MKAVILARVSTEEQRDAGNSLPAQIQRIETYCKRQGFEVVETFSFDESAYKTKRDEFDKIIEFLKQTDDKIAVCFDKVDRLSRNVFDKRVSELYEKAISDEIELHFVSDGQVINSQMSAVEKFQFGMSLGLAKYYSDAISDNVRRAFEQKRRKGEVTGRCVLGYININDVDGNKSLKPDPKRAHLIVKIFELYSTGLYSIKAIQQKLTELGLLSRAEKVLTKSTIERILNESFYYGMSYSKKYNAYHPHKYEKLISKALFDKCQHVKLKRQKAPSKNTDKDFILAGLLACEHCGCTISPEFKRKPSGKTYKLYSCTNSKEICKRRYVNEDDLLKPIYNIFDLFEQITDEIQNRLVDELRKTSEAELAFHKSQIARIQMEHNKLTDRKSRLLDAFLDQSITKPDYDKKLQEIMDRIQTLVMEIEEHSRADHDYKTTVATVLSVARRSREIFEGAELPEKRQFINFLVQNPKLKDRELVFELKQPMNTVLELAQYASQKRKTTSLSTDRPAWLGGWGSNPRPTGYT